MVTRTAILGAELPADTAENRFNLLPLLLAKGDGAVARPHTLHQTISLALAIRRGPEKYLDHRGSGGDSHGHRALQPFARADNAPDAPGELYNLDTDPGKRVDRCFKHPEIVRGLMGLLEDSRTARPAVKKTSLP